MTLPWPEVLALAASFLVGAIPFGWVVFRFREGRDIRSVGSGNIGATNVYRFGGKTWGIVVLVLDTLKGAVPAAVGLRIFGPGWTAALMAGAAVLGHCFTPFLLFRGGKGVATGLGALVVLAPMPVAIALAVFAAIVWATDYVSLGSMIAALTGAALSWVFGVSVPAASVATVCALLIVARHHRNIRNLLAGTEGKLRARGPEEPA